MRAWLGVAPPKNAETLDQVNVLVASTFFLYAVVVMVLGKKLF